MAAETHTDFEIAIERELHGALPEPEAKTLAEHLLGCATCRAYQATALEMETNMTAMSITLSRSFMNETLVERVRTGIRRRMFDGIWLLGLYPVFIIAVNLDVARREISWPMVVAMTISTLILHIGMWRRAQRKLDLVGYYDEGELFERWREEAAREASDAKLGPIGAVIAVLLGCAIAYFKPTTQLMMLMVPTLIFVTALSIHGFSVRRRVKRQLATLG